MPRVLASGAECEVDHDVPAAPGRRAISGPSSCQDVTGAVLTAPVRCSTRHGSGGFDLHRNPWMARDGVGDSCHEHDTMPGGAVAGDGSGTGHGRDLVDAGYDAVVRRSGDPTRSGGKPAPAPPDQVVLARTARTTRDGGSSSTDGDDATTTGPCVAPGRRRRQALPTATSARRIRHSIQTFLDEDRHRRTTCPSRHTSTRWRPRPA